MKGQPPKQTIQYAVLLKGKVHRPLKVTGAGILQQQQRTTDSSSTLVESALTAAGNNQSLRLDAPAAPKKNKRQPTGVQGCNNTPADFSPARVSGGGSSFALTEARSDFDSTCVMSVGGSTIDMAKDARFQAN